MTDEPLLWQEFRPQPLLKRPDNTPEKSKYPCVEVHNHLFAVLPADEMIKIMDEVGMKTFINLSGNVVIPFGVGGYTLKRIEFQWFVDNYISKYPGRFAAFTMSEFARFEDMDIFANPNFVDLTIQNMEADFAKGALGLKLTKELGLHFKDTDGSVVPVDDERLDPIWKRAGELGKPVLIHVSDPIGFFQPIDKANEHYPTLLEFPGWSFYGSQYSKWELLEQRNRMIARNPKTTYILPHVANLPEDLDSVAELLDRFPNVNIDFSARIDELGRQPYTAHDFFVKYQDRIVFGTDKPMDARTYRAYFRFLETRDEYFEHPDYIGRWGHSRWRIYGLGLPDEVLKKVYHENAYRIIPGIG
jgi:hypothetical protein